MLILSLAVVERKSVRLREEIPVDAPFWDDTGLILREPLRLDLDAQMVGEGVLVRGKMETEVAAECRRCLVPVAVRIGEDVDMLFEPLSEDEQVDLGGEVYPMPVQGHRLDLSEAVREQLLLRIPDHLLCSESCRGLCAMCGAELNRTTCNCVPVAESGRWDALKQIKFD